LFLYVAPSELEILVDANFYDISPLRGSGKPANHQKVLHAHL